MLSYGSRNAYQLVEWMELQAIFGVSKVTAYNHSMTDETARIFLHYAEEGFVDFRQTVPFRTETTGSPFHNMKMHQGTTLNDCILRKHAQLQEDPHHWLWWVDCSTAAQQSVWNDGRDQSKVQPLGTWGRITASEIRSFLLNLHPTRTCPPSWWQWPTEQAWKRKSWQAPEDHNWPHNMHTCGSAPLC